MQTSTFQQGGINVDAVKQLLLNNREDHVMAYLQEKLQGVCCPVHGSIPEIKLIPEPGGYSVDLLNDCCPAFTALCAAKVK
ncbi:dimerization/docking domain-containing protein [Hymenobacter mucosus]|uniref:Uncharacterized protein n=1 Tax=Hymenobacter mucosus TaxID=1411120 RepID=A0A238ZFE7_9BACT|nr:hypothetical protein [Hymenobacter mucosus]SNR81453.1 hypothetical protein SAMN06269173_107138 [Hymenobacter mucosus]